MPEKYKDQIEEILRQAEDVVAQDRPQPPAPKESTRRYVLRLPRVGMLQGLPRISSGKLMLAALALFLLALLLRSTVGPAMLFVWIGLVLFVVAYVMFFARPGTQQVEKRWRGRLLEDNPENLLKRLKRLLRG